MASKCAALFILILSAAVTGPAASAGAADTGPAAGAEDAVEGHVFIRAAVEEGYEADITVSLVPVFEGGTASEYHLDAENRYGVSDDIAEGSYVCVPFITDPEKDSGVYVEYGGGEKEVSQGEDTAFVVVAGSAGFVRDYVWISDLRDEDGECLKGVISRRKAEEAFWETIAGQRDQPETYEDSAWGGPEEVAAAGDGRLIPAVPVPEQETGTGKTGNGKGGLQAAPQTAAAVGLAACAAVLVIRKRR